MEFDTVHAKIIKKVAEMSPEEKQRIYEENKKVAEAFMQGLQQVELPDSRNTQFSALLALILSTCPLLDDSEESIGLAVHLKGLVEMVYSAGFADGFFEVQPKVILENSDRGLIYPIKIGHIDW